MNYAFSNSALDQTPFRNWLPQSSIASRLTYEQDPAAGYEKWLGSMNPSNANDTALRSLYNIFRTRYNSDIANNAGFIGPQMRWIDWLGGLDPNRELASRSREQRGGMNETRFNRPGARWVSF